jgi:hypothetical protein
MNFYANANLMPAWCHPLYFLYPILVWDLFAAMLQEPTWLRLASKLLFFEDFEDLKNF